MAKPQISSANDLQMFRQRWNEAVKSAEGLSPDAREKLAAVIGMIDGLGLLGREFSEIEDEAVATLSSGTLNQIGTSLLEILNQGVIPAVQIVRDTPNVPPPNVIATISSRYESIQNQSAIALAILHGRSSRLERYLDRAQEQLGAVDIVAIDVKKRLDAAEESLKRTQDVEAKATVKAVGNAFARTSIEHTKRAGQWLCAAVVTALTVVVVVLASLLCDNLQIKDAEFTPHAVQAFAGRAVILSMLLFALSAAMKNYRTHRHLAVVNEHRKNALRTFETFVDNARDEATKDQVLSETTKSIFAPVASGYMSGGDDVPNIGQLIEIVQKAKG